MRIFCQGEYYISVSVFMQGTRWVIIVKAVRMGTPVIVSTEKPIVIYQ